MAPATRKRRIKDLFPEASRSRPEAYPASYETFFQYLWKAAEQLLFFSPPYFSMWVADYNPNTGKQLLVGLRQTMAAFHYKNKDKMPSPSHSGTGEHIYKNKKPMVINGYKINSPKNGREIQCYNTEP